MKAEKSITVVAVTDDYRVASHVAAIEQTAHALLNKNVHIEKLLVSLARPDWLPDDIHWAQFPCKLLDAVSKAEYSRFMIQDLGLVIHTDFALTVQWDGYATNPEAWRPEFLDYDYIGAPFAANPVLEFFFPRFHNRVGNGGFSLRSKKWLDLGQSAPEFHGEAEDMFCTQKHVGHWKMNGCYVAPVELAGQFSIEYPLKRFPNLTVDRSFGFHGFLPDGRKRGYGKVDYRAMYWGMVKKKLKL